MMPYKNHPARSLHSFSVPLRVHILVDLAWRPEAGGHVKCWEAFARAALDIPERLDLTVHFSVDARTPATWRRSSLHELGSNVRYHLHRPLVSSALFPFLDHVPDHTDLAPYHPGLAKSLAGAQIIHTTDAFSNFSRTALRVAGRYGLPLVNSVHTDMPAYTRQSTAQTIQRLFGCGAVTRLLLDRLALDRRSEAMMQRRLMNHQAAADFVLLSRKEDEAMALMALPAERIGYLGRGLDKTCFHPQKRNREWLHQHYGIPRDGVVVLMVGRIDKIKRVHVVAEAVRTLVAQTLPVWLFCAGQGPERQAIIAALGQRALCPGFLPPSEVARVQASADIFAMPSQTETFGNAAAEALACGLPCLVGDKGGVKNLIRPGQNGLIIKGGVIEWTKALRVLVSEPARRARMATAARQAAEEDFFSWLEILQRDLLPVWSKVMAEKTPI